MHDMGISKFQRIFQGASIEAQKYLFANNNSTKYKTEDKFQGWSITNSSRAAGQYWHLILDQYREDPSIASFVTNVQDRKSRQYMANNPSWKGVKGLSTSQKGEVLDTLLFFVALLRTSVVNNVKNPMLGPPLLRLNFGTLYQSVPCICKSYNMKWIEDAKYDLETLTPRRITFSLKLEELRVGDWGSYVPGEVIARDNLTGWESAVDKPHTTDPLELGAFDGNSDEPSDLGRYGPGRIKSDPVPEGVDRFAEFR